MGKIATIYTTKILHNRLPVVFLCLLALFFRAAGLRHGLDGGSSFHPDVAKQVVATDNFLQGHVVWYTGSLAYDGYPYGLNHVDAALVRVLWPPVRAFNRYVHPGTQLPARPGIPALYILLRVFRVLYGMVAFAAFAFCLFKTGVSPGFRALWLLLAATAPLLSTVTHAAAGDVGTDMFVMLTLAALLPAREKPSAPAFLFAGLFTGFAFACKYHGILISLVPGLLLLFSGWNWGKRIGLGLLYTFGLGAGFSLLTPALFIRFSRTVKLIRDNFNYIRNYNMPEGFAEMPLLRRLAASLTSNLPIAARALGGILCVLLLATLVLLAVRKAHKANPSGIPLRARWDAAVLVTPFLILFLALSGKPMVQPFHFSFLPLPFLLGAALHWNHARRPLKFCVSMVLLLAAGENLLHQRGELFYRTREDTRALAFRVSEDLLRPPSEARNSRQLAMIAVEGPNLSVFRNRPAPALAWDGSDWADHPHDALPAIPHRFSTDWILLDLPAFPRDQRLVHLQPRERFRRTLVTRAPREVIAFQVRNGSRPAHLRLRMDRQTREIGLDPHESKTFRVSTGNGRDFTRGLWGGTLHAFEARVKGGPVLVQIDAERESVSPPPEREARKLARARFLEGHTRWPAGRTTSAILPEQHLPPARYALRVHPQFENEVAAVWIDDALTPHPSRRVEIPRSRVDGDGAGVYTWEFADPPLFSRVMIEWESPPRERVAWSLRPLASLPTPPSAARHRDASFRHTKRFDGEAVVVGDLRFPEQLAAGEPLVISPRIQTTGRRAEELGELVFFVHLIGENGQQAFARDVPLVRMTFPPEPALPQDLGVPDLPAGKYEIRVGIYRPRPEIRLRPNPARDQTDRDRRFKAGTLEITP